jgi:hypothetical protein
MVLQVMFPAVCEFAHERKHTTHGYERRQSFNEKNGEQAFPSLAVTTEQSARGGRMADRQRDSTTSHLDPNDWAELLNDDSSSGASASPTGGLGSGWRRRETSDA